MAINRVPEYPPLYNRCRSGKPHKIQRRKVHGTGERCEDNRRFADLFNQLYFNGQQVVDAGELVEASEVYHGKPGEVSLIGVNELTDCFGFQTSLWELFTILPYRGDKRIYNFAEVKKIIEDSESEYRIISDAKIQGRTIMEILEAYKILHEYYPENTLESLYREKKFDNSETDTIKKHEFHASLLGEKAFSIKHDAKEQKRLREAATAFRKLYNEERWRR